MKKGLKIFIFCILLSSTSVFAGNEDRAGEAGASELLINPWARSSGWGGANTSSSMGLESINLNVSGLAFVNNTELLFSHVNYLSGADISINSFGIAKNLGESSVLAITAMSMDFGDIQITEVNLPDGGNGTFSPSFLNIGISYAKAFSNSIYGGVTVRIISESIADASASGVAFDGGVRYVTGKNDRIKFGIAFRNVGPTMKYSGNGLSFQGEIQETETELTVNQRSADFEVPSLMNIGVSYDFFLVEPDSVGERYISDHRLTLAGNFTSNSFTQDQIRVGAEYAFMEKFMIRAGYVYENDVNDESMTRTAATGLSAGATVEVPLGQSGSTFGVDYSYRSTRSFNGSHSIGVRLNF